MHQLTRMKPNFNKILKESELSLVNPRGCSSKYIHIPMTPTNTCSSCKKLFDAKDISNNLFEKCLAVEVVKNWLKSDEVK